MKGEFVARSLAGGSVIVDGFQLVRIAPSQEHHSAASLVSEGIAMSC